MKSAKVNKVRLSIIIVYYKDLQSLLGLISSIKQSKLNFPYEIIVENNNLDEKIKPVINKVEKSILYIESPDNIGYGAGNNLGAKYSKGEFLLFVNPDTIIKPNALKTLVQFLKDKKDAAIVGPNFIYPNGKRIEYHGSRILTPLYAVFALSIINRIWPNNSISRNYFLKDSPINKFREVEVVSGTCFLIRKSVFEQIGGFDEHFFLFFEEIDLCKRVKELGWKVYIDPRAVVVHDWQPGEGGSELNRIYKASRFYYFKKNFGLLKAVIVELITNASKTYLILVLLMLLIIVIGLLFN